MKINKLLESKKIREGISSTEHVVKFQGKSSHTFTKDKKWEVDFDEAGNIVARTRHGKPSYFKGHINDKVNDFPSTDEDNIILAAREQHGLKFGNKNEAFEKDGGPFWYFTKHGLGPGMLPKGVNVVDTKEDDNFGTYIALDKVLTTQELKEYELVEKRPEMKEDMAQSIKRDTYFTFDSAKQPYFTNDPKKAESIKRSWMEHCKFVGSLGSADYYHINDTEYTLDEAFKPSDSGIQSVKIYNPYNYTIQELRVDNDNKTFERGNFTAGKADKKVKNRQEYEDIVDSLKELGYTEIKSDYRSLRNKTRKGVPTNEATLPRNASKIRATYKGNKDYYTGESSMVMTKDGGYWRSSETGTGYDTGFLRRSYDIEVLETDPNYKPNKTKPEYIVQGNYGYGWEDLTASDNPLEAKADLKAYRENELGVAHRLITRRVPVNESKSLEESRPDKEQTNTSNKKVTIKYGNSVKEVETCKPIKVTNKQLQDYRDNYSHVTIVESNSLKEDSDVYYVTVYEETSKSGPEEGGYTSYGWEAIHSKKFNTLDRARKYLNDFADGAEVIYNSGDTMEIIDEYGDTYKIRVETEEDRGSSNSPAKSWAQAEMGVEFDRPFFDDDGKRLPEDPKVTAKRKADREALKQEYIDKVNACTTKQEVMNILVDKKYDSLGDDFVTMAMDKYKELKESKSIKTFNESIKVDTIADYITDHYDFDDVDDKYACINSIKDSHEDTISEEELEQFIGAHNGKDKVEEGYEFNPNRADISWRPYDNEKGQVMADKWYASKYPDDEIGIEQLEGITLDDALKDRSILDHCDTQVRERVYAQLDKYIPMSKDSPMFKEVNEASYGGAFDIADDQYFTREDLDSFAEEVLNHINETFKTQFDIASCYIDDGVLEVGVSNDEFGDYIYSEKIDMRKIKEPWHLKRAYAFEFASQLINDIVRANDGLIEELNESRLSINDLKAFYETSTTISKERYPNFFVWYDYMVKSGKINQTHYLFGESYDDDVDDLTYYYEDEVFKHNLETNPYAEIESKQVPDSDGFMTDYTMYMDMTDGEYVFILGDKEVYCPDNGYFYFDWECETEEEAREWFANYHGFEESEFDDFEESYEVDKVFSAACNNRMDYMKKGFEKGKINPNDRFNRFNSDHSYIMGALRNGNKDMVKYLQDQGGTILDDEQDEYNRLMGEEVEQSPIVHKKNDGSYLVAADGGGYTAFSKDDVCQGHITATNDNEAKSKFNSNQFDEEFKNK